MKQNSHLLSCQDAARILGVSEQRVRTLCKEGKLGAEVVGRSWVMNEESVREYGMRSGHIVAEDRPVYHVNDRATERCPVALCFFSGALGLDLGIESSGFDVRLACECDKFCRQTISLNKPEMALIGDINDYDARSVRNAAGLSESDDVDLIIGGPPCQAFSTAGKRQGLNDSRGNVFLKYLEIALAIRPKFLVIENVRGLLSCPMEHRPHELRGADYPDLSQDERRGGALNFILDQLRRSGYSYSFNLYNAANFGSPQIRERVVIICSRDQQEIPFLTPTHSEKGDFGLPRWRTFRDAVAGIAKHTHLNFPEKRLKYYRMLQAGQNWRDLPEELQREALGASFHAGGGKTGFFRRLAWDKPSPTLVTHPAMPATDLAHPSEDRPLSIEEYKRVQEFPDDWKLAGPLVQQYKQVGNAVPSSLGKAIGNLIKNLLHDEKPLHMPDFPYSRYKKTSHLEWEAEFMHQLQTHKVYNFQAEFALA